MEGVDPSQDMNTGTRKNKAEEGLRYLDITDEILDGVFPEQDKRKLKKTKNGEECIIDIYGRPQLINHEEVSLRNRVGDQTNIIVEKKEETLINFIKLLNCYYRMLVSIYLFFLSLFSPSSPLYLSTLSVSSSLSFLSLV